MQIFPLPHIDDNNDMMISCWNFGKGFQFSYQTIHFHTELLKKKCFQELELKFLETEDRTRHRALNCLRSFV